MMCAAFCLTVMPSFSNITDVSTIGHSFKTDRCHTPSFHVAQYGDDIISRELTPGLPNKIFQNCHLVPNKFFRFSSLVPNKIFGFSLLVPDNLTVNFSPTTDRMIYFLNKVLVRCKNAVYLFCRELNSLQYGENSI